MDWQQLMETIHFKSEMWVVLLPCFLMVADIITGFTNAWAKKEVKSEIMRTGLAKKIGELFAILIVEVFSAAMELPQHIVIAVSLYVCFMEFISNVENIKKLGMPIPGQIDEQIDHLKDELKPKEQEEEDPDHENLHDGDG